MMENQCLRRTWMTRWKLRGSRKNGQQGLRIYLLTASRESGNGTNESKLLYGEG